MTVATTVNKIIYSGNASATVFPFTFSTPAAVPSDIVVYYTDTTGVVTQLATSAYTLTINAATATNPTPVGGSVTYNPGSPIPIGSSLTIMRTLPLQQNTSLANQGTLYQQVIEQALDYLLMSTQQVLEIQNRALVVNVSDPTPNAIPAVASRAGLVLGFDSSGNPIAVSTVPAGVVSSAMAPVVAAASLAAGRTALGLGAAAVEGIGPGLQDNGAGSLQTYYQTVADSTNQSVTSSFHSDVRAATGAITYTLPLSSTLWNGFGFWVYALTNQVTLAINGADAFNGTTTGASLVLPAGSRAFVSTTAAGTWYVRGMDNSGFNAPKNLSLSSSVGSGALTITVLDQNGNAPSPASPVIYDVSSNGSSTPRAVTTALSITVPSGATLGTVSGVSGRIWIGLFDNSGSPILGVYNCLQNSSPNYSLKPWDETSLQTTTAISAGATSAQTWYTSSGLTNAPFRIIGYIEATEATAGTWSTAASKIQLFGPGVKRPGDTVSESEILDNTTPTTSSNGTFVTLAGKTVTINIQSVVNLIRVDAATRLSSTAGVEGQVQLSRGNTGATGMIGSLGSCGISGTSATGFATGVALAYDKPEVTGNQIYSLQAKAVGSGSTVTVGGGTSMSAKEIMV